ncbi:MAG: helix-turn-helix transcriptional regulator [Candidatus Omnitrophica bacterium]|nr:helix-turn-helix transcriptional regulator [Candidatus Omnitrophota bacterium]
MSIPEIRLQFARNLKEERHKAKLTQEEIAEIIEVSVRYYQMLESKKPTAVKIDTIDKIAKAFKIRPAKLFNF